MKSQDSSRFVQLAIAAVFAALTCVTTLVLTLGVPATGGYFNVGEIVIYIAALLFGPRVGAFAGGVGASISDMIVAAQFAPGTLIVKGCEGAIVGLLNRTFRKTSKSHWRMLTVFLGVIVGMLLAVTGSLYYGQIQLYLGQPPPSSPNFVVSVPFALWYLAGAIAALLIMYMGFKAQRETGQAILSIMIGGLEMVAGYFLYERLVLGDATAAVEIPVNLGQMMIGLIVALPIVRIVLNSLPQLRTRTTATG
jgi:uncharacterized membrane protein